MSGGQRAFAQKLSKKGAAEVRKQVSSAYLNDLPKSVSGINLAAGHNVPLTEVVEPPDFEEFVSQHENVVERDPLRHLLEFPGDDVSVEVLQRHLRTITPIVPEPGAENDAHVRDCMKCYSTDYTVLTRRYEKCSKEHWLCEERDMTLKSSQRQDYEVDVDEPPPEPKTDKSPPELSNGVPRGLQPDTPRSSWASSVFDLTQADPLLPSLLTRQHQDQVDADNETSRQTGRHEAMFDLYPQQHEEDIIERRQPAEVPEEHSGHRILVKCVGLRLELEIEPIFASMALYDAKEKKKISENFYFDVTPEQIKKMLGGHIPYQDVSTLSRSCVFSLSNLSTDVFLVVKLEKVLQQGDITEVAEPYMKDDKNRDKVRQNAAYFCERLGKYRMPFAWTAIDLLQVINGGNNLKSDQQQQAQGRSDSLDRRSSMLAQYESFRKPASFIRHGSLERPKSSSLDNRTSLNMEDYTANVESFKPITISVNSFFKQETDKFTDEDLYKFLQDLKRASSVLKKLKIIPGVLKLDIQPSPEDLQYCLTPDLYRLDPFPDDKTRPTKEIVEFSAKEVYEPNVVYRNLLFVYPKALNFTNRQGSARNIAVKVQFMCGEEEHHALPVIFGKSSCPEYAKEAYTTVTYHSKSPDFYEELKIKLPARLTDAHHLLFTVYHVSCQKKLADSAAPPVETPIGYTWLPLLRDGRLTVGEFALPVSLEKPPPNYSVLHPDVQLPGMKWVDNHKGLLALGLSAVSSIHTLDEYLDRFLSMVHAAEEHKIPARIGELNFEKELIRSINDLANADGGPLVRFLVLVLDKLLQLMLRPPVIAGQLANVGQTCFEAMAVVAKRVTRLVEDRNDLHGRNALLTAYIQYSATLPHPDNSTPCTPTGPGGYNTLGRPSHLNVSPSHHPHQRSSSDPDLPNSNPASPDAEVAGLMMGGKGMERGGSFRSQQSEMTGQVDLTAAAYLPKPYSKKLVHEELAIQWVVSSGSTRDLAFANAWFLFELMVKGMGEHLSRTGRDRWERQARFSAQFMEDVTALTGLIIRDIIEKYNKDYYMTRSLNASLAFFLQDCFSLMDRGFVFQLIKKYCKAVCQRISQLADATSLVSLKLDFLRIVCAHEHYVALNLPFGTPLTPASAPASPSPSVSSSAAESIASSSSTLQMMESGGVFTELSTDYRAHHFMVGLVLGELALVLETNNSNLQQRAISVVRNLMNSHDADPRYREPEVKARVATLYLPIIGIVVDALPQLYDPSTAVMTSDPGGSRRGTRDLAGIDQDVARAIATSSVFGPRDDATAMTPGREYDPVTRARGRSQLSPEWTRHLLACFMWVIKSVERRVLLAWWAELSVSTLSQILEVLYFAIANFEYKGKKAMQQYSQLTIKKSVDMKSRLEDAILGSVSARSELMARRRQLPMPSTPRASRGNSEEPTTPTPESPPSPMESLPYTPRLRWRKDMTTWRQSADHTDTRPRLAVEADAQLEGALAAEISLTVVDVLEGIVSVVQQADTLQPVLAHVLRVLLHCLAVNQSATVLTHMLATQRAIVSKFPELLFEEETEQCADLCLRLLRHCSSPISNTRTHASASLYLLMRHNFEIGNNFARVKMQVTMSLSSLVGQNQNFNEEYLRKSLKTILTYAESDNELHETTFPEQVRDLVFNLHMILSDTVKMKAFQEDPEMLLDLMYRIAKGYQASPDLRLTWLQNMAAKHSERDNHAEAAQCLIHSAGLVAEYLNMLEDRPHLPIGCVSFQHISQNVLEESAVSDDVVSPDEEGICTGKYFSESGLVGLLEQAASSFTMAGMYEAVNCVYRVLIPIYEANRDFKKLSIVHGKLQDAFSNIVSLEGKRVFGTYFRVGFYGTRFGDLDGEEFVYKEPAITKLAEISHRLENFYCDKFGREHVRMIKDSNTVESSKLEPDKAYIQITYVEPYFDLYELPDRQTFFDKHYNIRRFMYATPYTLDGRAHGDLQDQYKKKTTLTTSHAFPYVKTRLSVIHRDQTELSPIEVAIEDIQKKSRELAIALRQEPPDPKMLQMVVQGCIGTTVNQGPVEIATVFLRPLTEQKNITPSKHHNKLRIAFKDLLKKCSDALARNKTLIGPDQREYQRELERNLASVRERLLPLISSAQALQAAAAANSNNSSKPKKHKRERHHDGSGGSMRRRPRSHVHSSVH